MKDPKKVLMGRKNKRSGSNFESRVRNFLRKFGFYVQRNTFGLYDIVAVPPQKITKEGLYQEMPEPLQNSFDLGIPLLLQPTRVKYPAKDKKLSLKNNSEKWTGLDYLVQPDYTKPRHDLIFTPCGELRV